MFEHRHEPLLPVGAFRRRLLASVALASAIVAISMGIGMAGYHWLGGLGWLDSFLNAAMILTGMGPVDRMDSAAGKMFSGCYALFSGLVFLTSFAIVVAPMLHRMLHALHRSERGVPGHE